MITERFTYADLTNDRTGHVSASIEDDGTTPYCDLCDEAEEMAWDKVRAKLGHDDFDLASC